MYKKFYTDLNFFQKNGITQEYFANILRMSQPNLNAMINGRRSISKTDSRKTPRTIRLIRVVALGWRRQYNRRYHYENRKHQPLWRESRWQRERWNTSWRKPIFFNKF